MYILRHYLKSLCFLKSAPSFSATKTKAMGLRLSHHKSHNTPQNFHYIYILFLLHCFFFENPLNMSVPLKLLLHTQRNVTENSKR